MFSTKRRPSASSPAGRGRRPVTAQLARLSLLAAASTALAGGMAAPSHAAGATAFVTAGNDVHYVGSSTANRIRVSSDSTGAVFLHDTVGGITPGAGCSRATDGVRCVAMPGEPKVDFVKLQLAGGNDEVTVQTSIRTLVEGGDGRDIHYGATTATGTNVTFIGGPGVDTVDYGQSTSGVLVHLGFNGAGRLGRDNDATDGTVENLLGTDFDDSLRGNAANNWIVGRLGADALRGGSGNDEIWAYEYNPTGSEADKPDLSCGSGTDVIILDNVDPGTAECESIRRVS